MVISSPPAVFTSVLPTGTSWAVKAAEGTTCRRSTAVRASLSASRLFKASLGTLDVPVGKTDVKTAGGEEITVTRDKYIKVKSSAGEAGVVAFDVLATNGVVHLVDTVF